jgi:hypothetical protein
MHNIGINAMAFISTIAKVHNNLFWQGLSNDYPLLNVSKCLQTFKNSCVAQFLLVPLRIKKPPYAVAFFVAKF